METNLSLKRQDRILDFVSACRSKNQDVAGEVLKEAFETENWPEHDLALLCTAAYDMRTELPFLNVFGEFNHRFPLSVYPVQALLASTRVFQGDFEGATEEARYYLAKLRQTGFIDRIGEHVMVQYGFAQSVLPATALYTKMGWRSYSRRILEFALERADQVKPQQAQPWENELASLMRELDDDNNRELDEKWEAFYATGSGERELRSLAESKKYDNFAARITLLGSELRFGNELRFEEEFFKSVYAEENGGEVTRRLQ